MLKVFTIVLAIWALYITKGSARPIVDINEQEGGSDENIAENSLPVFLIELQKCMNLQDKEERRECFDFTGKDAQFLQEIISNPDKIWGFVGNGSLEKSINFKVKNKVKSQDLHSVDLELYKTTLTFEQLVQISTEKCNFSKNGLTMQLITNDSHVIKTIHVTPTSLLINEWIGFQHIEEWYSNWMTLNAAGKTHNCSLPLELQIKMLLGQECSSEITLSDFGIESTIDGYQPLLVVYSKNNYVNEDFQLEFIEDLSNKLKEKRAVSASSLPSSEATSSGTYIENENDIHCHVVKYNASYDYLKIKFVGGFSLNFCAGSCHYPLTDDRFKTNNALLLAYLNANKQVTDKPSKPCCSAIEYNDLTGIMVEGVHEVYELMQIPDVTVSKCSCR